MLTTAATVDQAMNLYFAQSASKAVAVHGSLMDRLRDNAPRIVGTMKLAGDITFGTTDIVLKGIVNPWLISYTAIAGVGRVLMMIYGTKANQKKTAAKHQQEGDPDEAHKVSIVDKVRHPSKYPVEASSALSVVAETMGFGYGITQGTWTPVIVAIISVWSYVNILLGKEQKKEDPKNENAENQNQSLVFASSRSKKVGITGRIRKFMKENPVLTSSLTNIAVSLGMLLGGWAEMEMPYAIAGAVFIVANLVQALLVTKKGFNIEGAKEEAQAKAKEPPGSFQERLAQSRDNGLGLQPV